MAGTDADRRILVAYYSLTGNTERVAKDLAARLGADLEKIVDTKSRTGFLNYFGAAWDAMRGVTAQIRAPERNPADYALTIIGTPVWAWNMAPPVRAYIQQVKGKLNNFAFFITSGNTAPEKMVPIMEEAAGRKAAAVAGFNAQELTDATACDNKVTAFATAVRLIRASP
jgi:flavodoxin